MEEAFEYWKKWVLKPEQEKYRGKELKNDEMWCFAEDYHKYNFSELNIIEKMQSISEESLSPEVFEMWGKVKKQLEQNRTELN